MDFGTLSHRITEIMERLDKNLDLGRHRGGAWQAYEALYDLRGELTRPGTDGGFAPATLMRCEAGPSLAALPAGHSVTITAPDWKGDTPED